MTDEICATCNGLGFLQGRSLWFPKKCPDCGNIKFEETEEQKQKREAFDWKRFEDGQKIIQILSRLTKKYPSFRIGQLLINAVPSTDLFYIENGSLLDILEKYEKHLENINENSKPKDV